MGVVVKETLQGVIYVYFLIATLSIPPSRAGNNSLTPSGPKCACPGDEVTYTCSIRGGATTLWRGTALDCGPGDITLRHVNFQPQTINYCNGNITSEIVGIEGDCYISRLKITAIDNFNNTSVDCSLQNPDIMSVGNSTIYIFQEPSGFKVSSVNTTGITISWTENSFCSGSINYSISSNCSSIRCTIGRSEATCSNLPIATVCSFSIRSDVCEPMLTVNNAITVTLRRPQVDITPVYSPGSPSTLTKVILTIYPEPFLNVAGDGPSPIVDYSFSYSNENMNIPVCQESEGKCRRSIDFTCPPLAEIDVTLSASNMLGQGPATDPTTIGCTNVFVRVEYDSATSTITCNFLNEIDTSIKSCFLQKCDQMLAYSPRQDSTVEAPNSITLSVAIGDSDCYLVTANSTSFRTTVEVRTSVGTGNANTTAIVGISVGIVVGVIMVLIITIIVVVIIVRIVMMKRKRTPTTEETMQLTTTSNVQVPWKEFKHNAGFRRIQEPKADEIVERFQLHEVPIDNFKSIDIYKDYELKELTEEVNSELKIRVDRPFCLFEGELEDIPEQRSIAFLHEIINKLFFASNITTVKQNRNLSDMMTSLRKLFKGYKVFVESCESDEKRLKAPTSVLYEVQKTKSSTEGAAMSSAEGVITGGATNDNPRGVITGVATNDTPRGAIAGDSTNGNAATKDATTSATDSTPA